MNLAPSQVIGREDDTATLLLFSIMTLYATFLGEMQNSQNREEVLNTLFTFQAHLLGVKRSQVQVIKGSRQWVEQYISLKEFAQLFGGYVMWREPAEKTLEMPDEGFGVWGKRKAAKFRRILRERGAVFKVIEEEGPIQQLAIRSTF